MPLLLRLFAVLLMALPLRAEVAAPIAAGTFKQDPYHTRLTFRVSHLGFSNYTAFFTKMDATLQFDPANPEAMQVQAEVDAGSVETLFPDDSIDFNALLEGPEFLDAAQFPTITFKSTSVRVTAPNQAAVTGDLTLHGVTRPITLRVTYNGGYAGHPLDPGGARIGFSATGTLFRSDFGIGFGLPEPGSNLGIFDPVDILIETEFTNPDASGPQSGP